MTTLIAIEMRRALARPLVRVLIALALIGTAVAGVVTFIQTGKPSSDGPIKLTELWPTNGEDPILLVSCAVSCHRRARSPARPSPAPSGAPAPSSRCSRGSRGVCVSAWPEC